MINTTTDSYKRKILLVVQLALLAVLVRAVFKTGIILRNADKTFVSESTVGAESKVPVVGKEAAREPQAVSESPVQDYSAILERNLFENPALSMDTIKKPNAGDGSGSEDSSNKELKIALLGTVAGSPEISRAIIEDLEANISSLFRIGDTVGNASIEDIERDAIVVLHNGRRKTVHLGARGSKGRPADGTQPTLARDSAPGVGADQQDWHPTSVPEKLRYAASMLPKAVVRPYAVNGRTEGLEITGLEDIRYMEEIGLRNGDVIRTVNGHRLTSKQQAYQISIKARSQAIVSIELLRDNKVKTFSFDLS